MKRLLALALLLAPLGCGARVEVKKTPDLDVRTDDDVDIKRRGDGAPAVDVEVKK